MGIRQKIVDWLSNDNDNEEPVMNVDQARLDYEERRKAKREERGQYGGIVLKNIVPISASELPSEYDDAPLTGDVYVGGTCCRTVGELKAANLNFYE